MASRKRAWEALHERYAGSARRLERRLGPVLSLAQDVAGSSGGQSSKNVRNNYSTSIIHEFSTYYGDLPTTDTHGRERRRRVPMREQPGAWSSHPPRWGTSEFLVHYVVLCCGYAHLWRVGRDLTRRLSPAGQRSSLRGVVASSLPHVFGASVDVSDAQWRAFRAALPLLCAVAVSTAVAARLVRRRSLRRFTFLPHKRHAAACFAPKRRRAVSRARWADVCWHEAAPLCLA